MYQNVNRPMSLLRKQVMFVQNGIEIGSVVFERSNDTQTDKQTHTTSFVL